MYDSYMKSNTYPLAMPPDLLQEVRKVAAETGLSIADAMRQSMRLGLPKLKAQLSMYELKPLSAEERQVCWGIADPEFDALAAHCASLPTPQPDED
jgi:hypothetical protein